MCINVSPAVVGAMVRSVFFFQAEDGIRDPLVTGVQTCALPISIWSARSAHRRRVARRRRRERVLCCRASAPDRLRRRPEPEVFADRPCRLAPASHYGSANRHTRAGLLVDASFRRVHGGLQGSPRMKAMRLWPAVLLGAASLLILGCGDRSPLGAPSQAPTPHHALIDGPLAPTA